MFSMFVHFLVLFTVVLHYSELNTNITLMRFICDLVKIIFCKYCDTYCKILMSIDKQKKDQYLNRNSKKEGFLLIHEH